MVARAFAARSSREKGWTGYGGEWVSTFDCGHYRRGAVARPWPDLCASCQKAIERECAESKRATVRTLVLLSVWLLLLVLTCGGGPQ